MAGVSVPTSHLFPIDVAGGYGDHGGFAHKSCEEGPHAQGGSMDPGDEKVQAVSLLNPCGGTHSVKIQPTPRKGVDKRRQSIAFRVCTSYMGHLHEEGTWTSRQSCLPDPRASA